MSFFAALTAAAYLFFYKRAGVFTEPRILAFTLLLVAAILNTAFAFFEDRRTLSSHTVSGAEPRPASVTWSVSAFLALLTISGNWCSAEAIVELEPAVTSLLLRTEIVFVGLFGVIWLGEPIRKDLALGSLTALLGLLLMRWPLSLDGSLLGAAWGLGAAASFGLMQVATRRVIHRISPGVVNALRLWIAVVLFSFQPGLWTALSGVDVHFWPYVVGAAFLGPFIGRLCIMYSLRSLTAAHSALLLLLSPVLALLMGILIGGPAPTASELWGGALMLIGIAWPTVARLRAVPVSR